MFSKLLIGVFIISAVIETKCEYRMPEYTRIKRAKYYSSPPQRLYRRPPFSFPISGPYSNTPPPGYNMDDDEPPHPGNSRPYKITSSKALSETTPAITYGPSNIAPPIEPAPPASVARAQSDANLKAIRIWTHKSRGTAYTLHNDGSLSLEKPGKPKQIYGIS